MKRLQIDDTALERHCMSQFSVYCQSVSLDALMHLGLGYAPNLFFDKYAKLN